MITGSRMRIDLHMIGRQVHGIVNGVGLRFLTGPQSLSCNLGTVVMMRRLLVLPEGSMVHCGRGGCCWGGHVGGRLGQLVPRPGNV